MNLNYNKSAFLLFCIIFSASVYGQSINPNILTSADLKSQGAVSDIPAGSYLRLVNYKNNWDKWYHEVYLVNEDNRIINKSITKVSKKYLNSDLMSTTHDKLEFFNQSNGKTVKVPANRRYMITETSHSGWKTYEVQFYNENNIPVDHLNNPVSSPTTYKITMQYLNTDRAKGPILSLNEVQAILENPNQDIICSNEDEINKIREKLITPLAELKKGSLYGYLLKNRDNFLRGGYQSCVNKKDQIQKEFLSLHPYGQMSLAQRADQIYNEAVEVLKEVKASSKNKSSGKGYSNFVNGHYIDPVISPAVVACLTYQETRGHLHPFVLNYTYCNKNMTSSAHGLSQITRTTMMNMAENPDGKLLPLTSKFSKPYVGKTVRNIHESMSGDTKMQLEVLIRILNSNAKHVKWVSGNLSDATVLKKAVTQYDRDNQSKYVNNIMNNCLPCFKSGKKGSQCFKTIQ